MIKNIIHSNILAENTVDITPSSAWLNGEVKSTSTSKSKKLLNKRFFLLIHPPRLIKPKRD